MEAVLSGGGREEAVLSGVVEGGRREVGGCPFGSRGREEKEEVVLSGVVVLYGGAAKYWHTVEGGGWSTSLRLGSLVDVEVGSCGMERCGVGGTSAGG